MIGEGAAARRRLGYLPQRLTFPEGITAREVVDVAVRGPRELRLLTATFNDMAARLAALED